MIFTLQCSNNTKLTTTPVKEKSIINFHMENLRRSQHGVQTASKINSCRFGLAYGKAFVINNRNPVGALTTKEPKYSG